MGCQGAKVGPSFYICLDALMRLKPPSAGTVSLNGDGLYRDGLLS